MAKVTRSALVPYSAEALFDLINDVDAYPQYLPYCAEASVITRSDEEIVASMLFARAGLRHGVTTRNKLSRPYRMDIELVEGPFSFFEASWDFLSLDIAAAKVTFSVDFEINSALAHLAAGIAINSAAGSALDAFQKRAKKVLGA